MKMPLSLSPPPIDFNPFQYYKTRRQKLQIDTCTIFSANFSPDDGEDKNRYLLACTSLGTVYCWDVSGGDDKGRNCFSGRYWQDDENCEWKVFPVFCFQTSHKNIKLFHIKFYTSNNTHLLAVSGEEGIHLYRWSDLRKKITKHKQSWSQTSPPVVLESPTKLKPYPYPSYENTIEINCSSFDPQLNYLYGAAGDTFGCYQWDVTTETLLRTMNAKNNSDYLHVVQSHASQVLTGGEDGSMILWDAKQGKIIETVNIKQELSKQNKNISVTWDTDFASPTKRSFSDQKFWISDLDVEPNFQNWISLCGGQEGKRGIDNGGGFMALWNIPTRTLTSAHITCQTQQAIKYHNKYNKIVTLSNNQFVSYWDWSTAQRVQCAQSTLRSGYALDIHPVNGAMVVGGVSSGGGSEMDCFVDLGNVSFHFSL